MSFTVDFTPAEEARIRAAAQREGIEPAEVLKELVVRHLSPAASEESWKNRLRQWQEQDGVQLLPETPARDLFSRWAAQYEEMTEAVRAAEDRFWQEIEEALSDTGRTLDSRPVF